MTVAADLERDGFAIVRQVLPADVLASIDTAFDVAMSGNGAGTRALLAEPWCAALAAALRRDPRIAAALPATHLAVQCTAFEKSLDHASSKAGGASRRRVLHFVFGPRELPAGLAWAKLTLG